LGVSDNLDLFRRSFLVAEEGLEPPTRGL
jgi:hypothetical protein